MKIKTKDDVRKRLHERIRKKIHGTPARPRLAVFRSQAHIYAQLIDDDAGKTLCAASSLDKDLRARVKRGSNVTAAKEVGQLIASRAKEKGVAAVVFDRGGFQYHGRVKALADAARSEEHTSELQSRRDLVCRLLREKQKQKPTRSLRSPASPKW